MSGVKHSSEVSYGFGQMGSIHIRGTNAAQILLGNRVFVAISFLEDTKFATGDGGLNPDPNFPNLFPGSNVGVVSSDIDADAGVVTGTEVFPKGMTIYGRWISIDLASGGCIAYVGA